MKECVELNKYLSDFIEGLLDPGVKEKVSKHLEKCSDCRKELDLLKSTVINIKKAKLPFKEDDCLHDIWAKVGARIEQKEKTSGFYFKPFLIGVLSSAVVLLVVFLFVSISWEGSISENEETVSLAAGQIIASLISGTDSSMMYFDNNTKLIIDNRQMPQKEFLKYFKKNIPREVESIAIFVGKSPREIAYKERDAFNYPISYISKKTGSFEVSAMINEFDFGSEKNIVFVSVFIKNDGNFTFVLSKNKKDYKIKYMLKEVSI